MSICTLSDPNCEAYVDMYLGSVNPHSVVSLSLQITTESRLVGTTKRFVVNC